MDKKKEAKKLYLQGFSFRQIARMLGVSHPTVARWVRETPQPKESFGARLYKNLPAQLRNRLNVLLLTKTEEKGRVRVLSYAQIYRLLEIELRELGIDSLHKFYRFMDYYVPAEFGSKEALEFKRRGKKEAAKFRRPKDKVKRTPGVIELDGTGYTFKGKLYFIFLAREVYSGYFFDPYVIEAKDKSIKHYNKAITSYDIAKYLISLFEEWGLPTAVKTDNEKTLTSELITRALKELGVEIQRTKPYSPNQKLIERAIRDLKDTLRHLNTETFEDALVQAIEIYNRSEHKFEHFTHPVVPAEVIRSVEFKSTDPDDLRFAFAERFVRKVRDNTISVDGLKYEFPYPYYPKASDYGRKKDLPEVLCLRLIDDATKLYVYDPETGRRLGIANLVSTEVSELEPIDVKQEKNRQRRIRKRKEKVEQELLHLQASNTHEEFPVFEAEEPIKTFPATEKEEDPFDLFLGGEL